MFTWRLPPTDRSYCDEVIADIHFPRQWLQSCDWPTVSIYYVEVLHTCLTVSWLVSVVLAGGGVEEDNGENIQVPHAVDPCEESTVELEGVVSNVPVTLTDLMREHLESLKKRSWPSSDHEASGKRHSMLNVVSYYSLGLRWRRWQSRLHMLKLPASRTWTWRLHPKNSVQVTMSADMFYFHSCFIPPLFKADLIPQSSGLWHRRKLV